MKTRLTTLTLAGLLALTGCTKSPKIQKNDNQQNTPKLTGAMVTESYPSKIDNQKNTPEILFAGVTESYPSEIANSNHTVLSVVLVENKDGSVTIHYIDPAGKTAFTDTLSEQEFGEAFREARKLTPHVTKPMKPNQRSR